MSMHMWVNVNVNVNMIMGILLEQNIMDYELSSKDLTEINGVLYNILSSTNTHVP